MIILILVAAAAFIAHIPMLRKENCMTEIYVFTAMMALCLLFGGLYLISPGLMSVSNAVLSIFNLNI